jgi:hypothetical protein
MSVEVKACSDSVAAILMLSHSGADFLRRSVIFEE